MDPDTLAFDRVGDGERLVFVHGFTQTRRCWRYYVDHLSDRYEVLTVDAPGHGESGFPYADLPTGADLLATTCGQATYVGYSMGGRLTLHLAAQHPSLVERLVLIGATPGIRDATGRTERRASDNRLADRVEQIGTEAFVDEWLRLPLFAGLTPDAADREDRRRNRPEHLAASLRNAGTGNQVPMWDRLGAMTMPVLLIVGEHDDKFGAIADEMSELLPHATVEVVASAGHSAHLEQPEHTLTALRSWLAALS